MAEHRLVQSHHAHHKVHSHAFNRWIAVKVTSAVGTMWCAYVFMALALVSFPAALRAFLEGDTLSAVAWLSQAFLQLVLLPVIIVGQNVNQAAQDARAEADHEALNELLRRSEHGEHEEERSEMSPTLPVDD